MTVHKTPARITNVEESHSSINYPALGDTIKRMPYSQGAYFFGITDTRTAKWLCLIAQDQDH
jgi:hypothetical protein